ncbi:MAG: hypothetical protein ACJA2M_001899 [Polaribacter sp.]|jgi:hypothetical protein
MIKIKSIDFLSSIEDIDDIFDDNMDVSVDLENGRNYVVVVGTPKNLLKLMENEKSNFLSPGDPIIIVKKMTKEVVEEAIKAYVDDDDAYYLKFYAAELDIKTLNVLKDRYIVRDKFLDDLLEKGESIDIEN